MTHTVDTKARTISDGLYTYSYTGDVFVDAHWFDRKDDRQRAVVFHDAGFVLAIVWSGNRYHGVDESDALDAAVDSGKLDRFQVTESELTSGDYFCTTHDTSEKHEQSEALGWCEFEGITHLGNASEPFDIESLGMFVMDASAFALDAAIIEAIGESVLGDILYLLRSARTDLLADNSRAKDFDVVTYEAYEAAEEFLEQHSAEKFPEVVKQNG